MTNPPDYLELDSAGRAAWARTRSRLLATGDWRSEYTNGLGLLCSQCEAYLKFARQVNLTKQCTSESLTKLRAAVNAYLRIGGERRRREHQGCA